MQALFAQFVGMRRQRCCMPVPTRDALRTPWLGEGSEQSHFG